MKQKETILKPVKPIIEIFKQMVEDKKYIQKAIKEGKEHELKGRFKFVKPVH